MVISQKNNYGEWWKGEQKSVTKNYVASSKNNFEDTTHAHLKNIDTERRNKIIDRNIKKYSMKPRVLENKKKMNLALDSKSEIVKINNKIPSPVNNNFENKKSGKEKFNEINFDYPNWSPDSFEIDKNKNDLKSKDLINKRYMDLKNKNIGSNLNLKL